MSRNVKFAPGEFYHLYNRGVDKRKIFLSTSDYARFLSLLYLANGTVPIDIKVQGQILEQVTQIERGQPLVGIGAYCLMPNHFHILLCEIKDGGISAFMHRLSTAYTMYFNKRRKRSGSLFEGTFKATHAHDDNYLSYLISYIHLNPVKLIDPDWKETGIKDREKTEKYLAKYPYSSFLDYKGENRPESGILQKNALPEYFETPKEFVEIVTEWLNYNVIPNKA